MNNDTYIDIKKNFPNPMSPPASPRTAPGTKAAAVGLMVQAARPQPGSSAGGPGPHGGSGGLTVRAPPPRPLGGRNRQSL